MLPGASDVHNGRVETQPDADHAFQPGTRVGNLTIERELGRGGFAVVYLARDAILDRPVALKVLSLPEGAAISDEQRRSFLAEARIVGGFRTPHVVTLYHVHEHQGSGWMIEMEYVGGGSLRDRLGDGRSLPVSQVVDVLTGVLRGLQSAHERGVFHRDIKPANVLIADDGVAKLADFGTAHVLGNQSLSTHSDGLIVGTPWYMAPEMLLGRTPTAASDLWSVGVLAYEMLTGELPFPQTGLSSLFFAVQNTAPPPLGRSVPRELAGLVMRCLVKRPEDRVSTADALLRTLQRTSGTFHLSDFVDSSPAPATTVFGRDRELDDAQRWLDTVIGGRAATLRITGVTGMGKGAFVEEVRLRAQQRDLRWVSASATSGESVLAGLAAALGAVYGDRIERDGEGDVEQLRAATAREENAPVRWAVEHMLGRLLEDACVIVAVEDAHELGKAEAKALCKLARRFDSTRFGLLFVGSPDGCDVAAAAADLRDVRSIALEGLSMEALYQHLEHYASGLSVPADVVRRIAQVTDGTPLFAEQVLEHLVARGALVASSGVYVATEGWRSTDLPERFLDAAVRRLDELDEGDRELLEVAAVDGREFDGNALAAVSGQPLLQVLRRLQSLCRGRAVLEPSETGYRFRSGMLQLALYDALAPEMRAAIHRALAEHLEMRTGGVLPERIARHWELSDELERARPHLIDAARRAFGREDLARFTDLARRAGLVAGDAGELLAGDRDLAVQLARTLREQGLSDDSATVLDALQSHAESTQDEDLASFLAVYRIVVPGFDGSAAQFDTEALRAAAERTADPCARLEADLVLGKRAKRAGDLDAAERHLGRAAESARALDDRRVLSATLDQIGSVALRRGELEKARRLYREASALSSEIGRAGNAAVSLVNCALAGLQLGELEESATAFESALRTFELEGIAHHAAQVRSMLAETRDSLGESERALQLLDAAIPVLQEKHHVAGLLHAVMVKGRILAARGRLESATLLLDQALELAEHAGDHGTRADVLADAALLDCFAGRAESAAENAREAIELRRSTKQSMASVASTLFVATLFGLDWTLVEGLDRLIPEGGTPLEERSAEGIRAQVRAACALGRGGSETAVLREGSAALRRRETAQRAASELAACWLDAEVARRVGARADAARHALEGARAAQSLGHVWFEVALLSLAGSIDPGGEHVRRVTAIVGKISDGLRDGKDRTLLLGRWSIREDDT